MGATGLRGSERFCGFWGSLRGPPGSSETSPCIGAAGWTFPVCHTFFWREILWSFPIWASKPCKIWRSENFTKSDAEIHDTLGREKREKNHSALLRFRVVVWGIGMLIYLPVNSWPLIWDSLQKGACLSPCDFATTILTSCIVHYCLPVTRDPWHRGPFRNSWEEEMLQAAPVGQELG